MRGKIIIKYGLIAGLILSGMAVVGFLMEGGNGKFDSGQSIGYIFQIAAFLMIFLGIREHRDKLLGGSINFTMAFRTGLLIVIIGSLMYTLTWMIYIHFVDTGFTDRYTEFMVDQIKNQITDPAEAEKNIEAFRKNMTEFKHPATRSMYTFLEVFPPGLLITILCALLMRRSVSTALS